MSAGRCGEIVEKSPCCSGVEGKNELEDGMKGHEGGDSGNGRMNKQ